MSASCCPWPRPAMHACHPPRTLHDAMRASLCGVSQSPAASLRCGSSQTNLRTHSVTTTTTYLCCNTTSTFAVPCGRCCDGPVGIHGPTHLGRGSSRRTRRQAESRLGGAITLRSPKGGGILRSPSRRMGWTARQRTVTIRATWHQRRPSNAAARWCRRCHLTRCPRRAPHRAPTLGSARHPHGFAS